MHPSEIKYFASVVLLLIALDVQTQPQTKNEDEWCRIQSPAKDFSFSIPCIGHLVDNEDGAFRIYRRGDLWLSVTMSKSKFAKENFIASMRFLTPEDKSKDKFFQRGDFLVRQHNENKDQPKPYQSTWLYLASSKGSYTVFVSSKTIPDSRLSRLLHSIRIGENPLFVAKEIFPEESTSLNISDLKTDAVVLDALRMPDSKQAKLEKETNPDQPDDNVVYSKDMVVLRKPRPGYTDSARSGNVQGTVVFNVLFMADGTIGLIRLKSSLDKDLDNQAFKAAKRIKFLPAETDGKPVDRWRNVEYAFSIY